MSPRALEHDERRRSRRAPLSLPVQYRFNSHEEFRVEYARDVSAGGMFIRTQEPGALGALLYLQFYLRDRQKLIEGLGRVVHVHSPAQHGAEAGMGVEFVQLDEESVQHIKEMVQKRSAEQSAPP